MRTRLLTLALLVVAVPLLAQTQSATKPAPRLPNGRPDFSGLWQGGGPIDDIALGLPKGESIPILPSAKKIMDARLSKDDPQANCLPSGVPRIAPYPWRIVQTPTHIFFLFEANIHSYRQIFMDGRGHPDDLELTWYGHSIGHWEGDTLVVESRNFNGKPWLNEAGEITSHALTVVERFTPVNANTIIYRATLTDPLVYTRPFTVEVQFNRDPNGEMLEVACHEDNQDLQHMKDVKDAGVGLEKK
jgi:hypothetical protein